MKIKKEKEILKKGLDYVIRKLTPKTLIIYGTTTDDIFE